MGIGTWFRRLFGKSPGGQDLVPFYDVHSKRVIRIPKKELAPGCIRARIHGIGIDDPVFVAGDQLHQPGPLIHPPFDEDVRPYIGQIQIAFAEHRRLSVEEWEDGFRRDRNPDQEIALWIHAAMIYSTRVTFPHRRSALFPAAMLVAIVLASASCKEKTATPSPDSQRGPSPKQTVGSKPEVRVFVPQPDRAATAEIVIDPKSAARVDLPDGASIRLLPGTAKEPTSFKASRLLNTPGTLGSQGLASPVYELSLGADGKGQPLQPVEVTLPLLKEFRGRPGLAGKLALARWDGAQWRPRAARVDPVKGIVEATVDHFSSVSVVATSRFEPGPGRLFLNPPGLGDLSDRRVPRGATAECVILAGPAATFERVRIDGLEIGNGFGKFKSGSGPIRREPDGAFTKCNFTVRVPPDASLGPRDVELFGGQEGPQNFPGHLVVCSPLVMIIDIDGMRQDVFNDALQGPPSGYHHLPRLFGSFESAHSEKGLTWDQYRSGVALQETTTIFPSVTFAGHAVIFSGTDLGALRMGGNEWFDRRLPRRFGFTIDAGDTRGSYNGEDFGPLKFGGKGVANSRMKASGAKTVYEWASEDFHYRSVVFHNMYYEGAEWQPYTWLKDEGLYFFCPFSTQAEYSMGAKAIAAIGRLQQDLGILTLYYAGADHHGHERYDPADLAERQRVYLTGFPPGAPLPSWAAWDARAAVSIDTNFGRVLESLSDVMYKETTYIFIADHGQSGLTVPRDGGDDRNAEIRCFKTSRSNKSLHKLSDLVFEAGFIPSGSYDTGGLVFNTSVAPEDATALVGLNGGMAHIYLRRPKPGTTLAPESVARTVNDDELKHAADGYESWDKPARYEDILRVAAKLGELQFAQPVPVQDYAESIDLILVRNSEKDTIGPDWFSANYLVYRGADKPVPVLDYLKSPAGRAWMKSPRMRWRGDDRDAEMIADRIKRLQSFVSGDLVVLPRYPDFYFQYSPINGDHGSITRNDMEIPFAVVRPGLPKPDALVKVLQKTIDLETKNRPANTDVRDTALEFLKRDAPEASPEPGNLEILATRVDGSKFSEGVTKVEFRCEDLPALPPKDLPFRLYRAPSPDGPWTFAGGKYPGNGVPGAFSSVVDRSGPNTAVIQDFATRRDYDLQPSFYRVARVSPTKDEEVYSPVWRPAPPILVVRRRSGNDMPITGDYVLDLPAPREFDDLRVLRLQLRVSMIQPDQAFRYPGAHFTVGWGGGTWHAWSGRRTEKESFGSNAGDAQVDLPARFGGTSLTLRGEGVRGGAAELALNVKFDPPWSADRKAAAGTPIDEDPYVKGYLPRGEEAATRALAVEKKLSAETDPARKAELRVELLELQRVALELEEVRLRALLVRARESWAATDGPGAVEYAGLWAKSHPDWAQRRLAWVDRAIEWDEMDKSSNRTEINARYRKEAKRGVENDWGRGLWLALRLAWWAGDWESARYFGMKLAALIVSSTPKTEGATPFIFAETVSLPEVHLILASVAAEGTGDRLGAAAVFPVGFIKPAWWPDTAPPAPGGQDQELQSLEKSLFQRMAGVQAKKKIRIRPGS